MALCKLDHHVPELPAVDPPVKTLFMLGVFFIRSNLIIRGRIDQSYPTKCLFLYLLDGLAVMGYLVQHNLLGSWSWNMVREDIGDRGSSSDHRTL